MLSIVLCSLQVGFFLQRLIDNSAGTEDRIDSYRYSGSIASSGSQSNEYD